MAENESLFSEERRQVILELIKLHEKVTVAQLCEIFNMSSATIRNDLRELESSGLLKRTHGGAIANNKINYEPNSNYKKNLYIEEKKSVARVALDLIEDGDTIILDAGTTTFQLAKLLHKKSNVTVITNDLQIALCLEDIIKINILLIGGFIKKKFHCTVGLTGSNIFTNLSVEKAFMGTNGITISKGATTPDIIQGEMKKAMIAIADQVIIVCDNNKIGRKSFYQFAPIDQVDAIIVDRIEPVLKKKFESEGVDILVSE